MSDSVPSSPQETLLELGADFTALADEIDALNEHEAGAPDPSDLNAWVEIDLGATRRADLPKTRRRRRFQQLVDRAGQLLIALALDQKLADERLEAMAHEFDAGSIGAIPGTPANLFALYVGGPRIELTDGNGRVLEYETQGTGSPPQFRPAKPRTLLWSQPLEIRLLPEPDPDQCRRYGRECQHLAALLPATPPKSPAETADKAQVDAEKSLEPAERKAYTLYELVARERPDLETDKEAYQYLKENGHFETIGVNWSVASFSAMVRKGRKAMGTQKNKPRSGRTGRNVRRPDTL